MKLIFVHFCVIFLVIHFIVHNRMKIIFKWNSTINRLRNTVLYHLSLLSTETNWKTKKSIGSLLNLFHEPVLLWYQSQTKKKKKHKKRTLETNIPYEQRNKNLQYNTSKMNPTSYKKDYPPWPSRIYPRNAKLA